MEGQETGDKGTRGRGDGETRRQGGKGAMSHEVDKPTHEVVGSLSRFDERDSVFARERLVPGSPLERAYHAMHQELAEIDRRLARFIEQVSEPGDGADQVGGQQRGARGEKAERSSNLLPLSGQCGIGSLSVR